MSAKSGVAVRSAGGPAGEGKDAASLAAGESAPAARPDPAGGRTRQEAPKPRAQPPQQPPPVQRLVLRYAKRGRARFASHRDFARAFERALRRAFLPMAYSSGFNPHPRISWANPAPTGAESEAEYVEIGLADRISPAVAAAALNQVLPAGFAVLAAVPSPGGAWTTPLTASEWEIGLGPVPTAALASALGRFLAAAEARVSRLTKNGERVFDARAAVAAATLGAGPGEAISSALPPAAGRAEEPSPDQSGGDGFSVLRPAGFGKEDADRPFWQSQDEAETRSAQGRRRGGESAASSSLWLALRHSEPLVRPDDVVTALRLLEPALAVGPPARLRRLVQGPLGAGGRVEDPFGA
ncbi:MAG: TIGR03936 family radical SAM-associated protein [Propionibacteriaceae bacterium]|nr:TIGR03936 family radical SAM-associated protein [Propionibacteriaceae bacterium]